MANLKEAFQYAAQNPNSDFANNLKQMASSGALNVEAKKYGIDLTPFQPQTVEQPKPQETVTEKVAGFTGGKTISQGIGQAIANPEIAKQQEQILNDTVKQQGELLKKKKEIQALGGDTTAIDKGLEYNKQNLEQISSGMEGLLNQKNITEKQVIGDALQLGTTIAGAGSYSKAGLTGKKALTTGLQKELPSALGKVAEATTFGQGVEQGAIQGAKVGVGFGASSGVSGALKENKSASEIAQAGLGGAIEGGARGAVLGGVVGGISGGLKGRAIKKANQETNFAQDLVSPKATEQVKQQALREGRVTEQGLLNASKITPSKRDLELADAVKGVVSSKKSTIENLDAISKKVKEINTGVKAYVAENKVPFNTNQLKTQLNKGKSELNIIFASDKNAEKTYDAVVKEFLKHVDSKDTAGLLDARQEFDKIPAIKKLLDSQGLGENVKKEIVMTARTKANEYIASLLPKGNKYRETLLKESKMIEAIGNIIDKNTGEIGTNKLQIFEKKYPIIAGALGGVGATLLGLKAIGVGKSIIGSTD